MPIIIGEDNQTRTPYIKRMIRCPGHYLVPPTVDVYLREPVEWAKQCSDWVELAGKKINIKKTRIKKDAFGRKLVDWKKLHKLRDAGIVMQPKVSAAWVIENIYDPLSWLCMNCPKHCKEGQGRVIISSINRLMGRKCKER
jgi:hypothetical protein